MRKHYETNGFCQWVKAELHNADPFQGQNWAGVFARKAFTFSSQNFGINIRDYKYVKEIPTILTLPPLFLANIRSYERLISNHYF